MPKYKARIDRNQVEIVKTFRQYGASVVHTHTLGRGFPDIVVGYQGNNFLIEIKDWLKPESQRKLTEAEQEFSNNWKGQYDIIESVGDVVSFMETITRRKNNGTF